MQLKTIFTDEDAVSPVIGVILMVAITVILAAVIGAFVLGIGGSQEKVPSASFSGQENADGDGYESVGGSLDDDDKFTIKHDGGGAVAWNEISVIVSDSSGNTNNLGQEIDPTSSDHAGKYFVDTTEKSGDMTAGGSITIKEHDEGGDGAASDADLFLISGDKVSFVWSSTSSDQSQVLWSTTL